MCPPTPCIPHLRNPTERWYGTRPLSCWWRLTPEGRSGSGYTYAAPGAARLICDLLAEAVLRIDAMAVPTAWHAMNRAVRNLGRPGLSAMAIAAVDVALWDLKARLLDLPLVSLIGPVRQSIAVYRSGGFTSYSIEQLRSQLRAWVESGIESGKDEGRQES